MKPKRQIAESSALKTRKRKGTVFAADGQDDSTLNTISPVVVAKKIKHIDQEFSQAKLNSNKSASTNGNADKAKKEGMWFEATEKTNAAKGSAVVTRSKPETVSGIKQKKNVSTISSKTTAKTKQPHSQISGGQSQKPKANKGLCLESTQSQAAHQPKVPKLELHNHKGKKSDGLSDKQLVLKTSYDDKTCGRGTSVTPSKNRISHGKGKGKQKANPSSSLSITSGITDKGIGQAKVVDISDPMAMLMMMEGSTDPKPEKARSNASSILLSSPSSSALSLVKPSTSTPKASTSKRSKKRQATQPGHEDSSGSEGLSDWEDVHDHPDSGEKSQVPDGPVEITLDIPDILKHKKRKKREFDWKGYLERRVRRFKKEVAMDMHKVHLLCLLSLGVRQNEELNDLTLSGLVMSVMPARLSSLITDGGSSVVERRVEAVLAWYKKTFSLEHIKFCSNIRLVLASAMEKCVSEGVINDARTWVMVFICILRTLGLSVRLVLSFQAMSFKASQEQDNRGSSREKQAKKNKGSSKPVKKSSKPAAVPSSSKSPKTSSSKEKKQSSKPKTASDKKVSEGNRKTLRRASSEKAKKNFKESDEFSEDDDKKDTQETKGKKEMKKSVQVKEKRSEKTTKDDDTDFHGSESEFEDTSPYFSSPSHLRKDLKILSNRKVLSASSSEAEDASINRSTIAGHDFWLELYFPDKKRWMCFDCFKGLFGKPYSLENSATQPLTYVVAFKNDGGVKDVTARYAKLWMSHTRKQRADEEWWRDSLGPFNTTPLTDEREEDDEIKGKLLVRPMPTSIADLKSHPLYALRRHLLKFEAIYPDTAIPLGYIKQEPIYARECVRTLHSRDNWLKEGRMVRLAEQPYKMVKSRPKWNKPKENPDELDLELYGEWQTEKYIPPPAVNGKVPKNEYGNVELFKPWMLPMGTVQLKVNGLQRVAKKLGIDVAQAMVGWDHHSGHPHPLFDGFVVCEEYADTLMVAWTEDQEIQEQRETEKREKRVYGNWRLLIRGLLIKNRLTEKFSQVDLNVMDKKEKLLKGVEELKKQEDQEEEEALANAESAVDVQQSWPRRQQDEVKDKKIKDNKVKIEKAQNLLLNGLGQGNLLDWDVKKGPVKDEINCEAGTSKSSTSKRSNLNSKISFKCEKTKGGNIKKRKSATKGQVKSRALQKEKVETEDETDSEEDFSDEVDGEKLVVKAKLSSRPKRKSLSAVKYFDSDEDAEDFVDDSDNDNDFVLDKGKKRRGQRNISKMENSSSEDSSNDGVEKDKDIAKYSECLEKPDTGDRHWLDEDGSSSDEEDFVPVEPGESASSVENCPPKEITIDLDSDKIRFTNLAKSESGEIPASTENSVHAESCNKEFEEKDGQFCREDDIEMSEKSQVSPAVKKIGGRNSQTKELEGISVHGGTGAKQKTSSSLEDKDEKKKGVNEKKGKTGTIKSQMRNYTRGSRKNLSTGNGIDQTSDINSNNSKKASADEEKNGKRKSVRLTRQTS